MLVIQSCGVSRSWRVTELLLAPRRVCTVISSSFYPTVAANSRFDHSHTSSVCSLDQRVQTQMTHNCQSLICRSWPHQNQPIGIVTITNSGFAASFIQHVLHLPDQLCGGVYAWEEELLPARTKASALCQVFLAPRPRSSRTPGLR